MKTTQRIAQRRAAQPAPRSSGLSMVESLVALLVLSIGMLGLARLHAGVRLAAEQSRHRSEAVRLAQHDLEAARAFVRRAPGVSAHDETGFDDIADRAAAAVPGASSNAAYTLERLVDTGADGAYKSVTTQVRWTDRTGRPQAVRLDGMIAGTEPALGALLLAGPARGTPFAPQARDVAVPARAHPLDKGRSVLKPQPRGTLAWLLDNASGRITHRCNAPADVPTTRLAAADLSDCAAAPGLLVAGFVNFAAGIRALPLSMTLRPANAHAAPAHHCADDSADALALGRTVVAYHCGVFPASAPPRWSGRIDIVPQGWALGADAPGQYAVCRYSRDADGDGHIGNDEHPQTYLDVDHSLSQQNFLVIPAGGACPASALLHQPAWTGSDVLSAAHQP